MTALDLARRLVAAPQWRRIPGMTSHPKRRRKGTAFVPDLADPANDCALLLMLADDGGVCVEAMVRAWGNGLPQDTLGEAVAKALLEVWDG